MAAFRDETMEPNVDHSGYRGASLFLLNQFEFLAAGTRSGDIDRVLMDKTMAGPIRNLVTTYSEEIVEMRRTAPRAFDNLIRLHRTISGSQEPDLGPDNNGDGTVANLRLRVNRAPCIGARSPRQGGKDFVFNVLARRGE